MSLRSFAKLARRSIRLLPSERHTLEIGLKKYMENTPVRLQGEFRHLPVMRLFTSIFPGMLLKKAPAPHLRPEEYREMRETLLRHMHAEPLQRAVEVPLERDPLVAFWGPFRMLLSATAVFLLLASGVSYAAEWALPTDVLYPFKILINEPLADALNFGAEAQARNGVHLVQRRLNEAVALAASHRLDADQSARLQVTFTAQALQAEERIHSLLRRGLEDAALEVLTTFEVSLGSYGMTLADLLEGETNIAETADELLRAVGAEEDRIAASGGAVASGIVNEGRDVHRAIEATSRATEVHLKRMQVTASALRPGLESNDSVRFNANLRSAESHLREADVRMNAGEHSEALKAAKQGLQSAESAELLLTVEEAKVGRARILPDWNINFVPGTRRELRERTEVHQERERLKQEEQQAEERE